MIKDKELIKLGQMTESNLKRFEELLHKYKTRRDECSADELSELITFRTLIIEKKLIDSLSEIKKRIDALERRIESLETEEKE
ncbi:hypothetical protein ES703_126069 [subsurface metagenome]